MEIPGIIWIPEDPKAERVLVDLRKLRRLLGDEILTHLLRAMVWVDRMVTVSFADATMRRSPLSDTGLLRDAETMQHLLVGFLREAARAVNDAVNAGLPGLIPSSDQSLAALLAFEQRWNRDGLCTLVRNKIAFHVDAAEVARGLELFDSPTPATLYECIPPQKRGMGRFALAHRTLVHGALAFLEEDPERAVSELSDLDAGAALAEGEARATRVRNLAYGDMDGLERNLLRVFWAACEGAAAGRVAAPRPTVQKPSARERLEQVRQALQRARIEVRGDWSEEDLPSQVAALAGEIRGLRAAKSTQDSMALQEKTDALGDAPQVKEPKG